MGALFAAARLGKPRPASPSVVRRVLRPIALVVLVSVFFGTLIGIADAKRSASAPAWRQVREARQRLDPKNKTNNPELWKQQLVEGEAKLTASEHSGIEATTVVKGVVRTSSIALFLSGIIGGLALLRFRIAP